MASRYVTNDVALGLIGLADVIEEIKFLYFFLHIGELDHFFPQQLSGRSPYCSL